MEAVEDVVIVGAGVAGLATALGLHRHFSKQISLNIFLEVIYFYSDLYLSQANQ